MDVNLSESREKQGVLGDVDLQHDRHVMLFTDIEGSTALVERLGDAYVDVLTRHHDILRAAIEKSGGREVDTAGDAFFVLFEDVPAAVDGALQAQRMLQAADWFGGVTVRVRMGIHTGRLKLVNREYVGIDVHRASRICDSGHGGQITLSREAAEAITASGMPEGTELRSLGRHRLKDLRFPETLFDIVADGVLQDFKPVRSLNYLPTNLQKTDTKVFGRAQDAERLYQLLGTNQNRLITLTGTGGVGKSSLAKSVATNMMDAFRDGVYLFELSGLEDAALVMPTVAQVIGVRDFPGRPVVIDVASAVGTRKELFIFDTFEHLIDARAELATLIDECPNLHVIVTSRTPIKLNRETILDLAPLPTPPENANAAALMENPCAMLFVERVQKLLPGFELDDENAPMIAAICRRLEGIPLAIELAATRVRLIGLDSLLDRLSAVLKLLKGGGDLAEDRHRTLRAAIKWSDDLLTENERLVFRLVSVFSGGFRFDEADLMLEDMVDDDIDLLQEVGSLVDNGLLISTSVNGEPRLKMLDMVREYASGAYRTETDPSDLQNRHLALFADVAERCAGMALKAGQRRHINRLEAETDNIRAALSWALSQQDVGSVARIFYALHWYWISQAYFTEATSWMEKAIALAEEMGQQNRATALIYEAACSIKMGSGDYAGGEPYGRRAVETFDQIGDKEGATRAGLTHCICATVVGQIEDPSGQLMEAIEFFRGKDDYAAALGLILLGEGARMEGVLDAAEHCYSDAMALLEAGQNVYWPGHLKQNIAHFRLKTGDWEAAVALLAEAFDLAEDYDFPLVSNLCVAGFGGVAIKRGDAELAARILGAVEHNLKQIGVVFEPTDRADVDSYVTEARVALGDARYEACAANGVKTLWDDLRKAARAQAGLLEGKAAQ